MSTATRRLSLFGAPGTNTNLGLNALMQGVVAGVHHHDRDAQLTVFDNQLGVRRTEVQLADGQAHLDLIGARLSRRVTRRESFAAMRAALLVGGRGNPGARAVLRSTAVLDVSGGDSFSDLYGWHRFRTVCAPKRLALAAGRPLVLLPQTYGPFRDPRAAEQARQLVLGAQQAWARDPDSYAALRELLGPAFDPRRHRDGVDLAVLLQPALPHDLPRDVSDALNGSPRPVGVNVSGLLWNQPGHFGLAADYRRAMSLLVERLVDAGALVMIVPHVLGSVLGQESDNLAGDELVESLPERVRPKVHTIRQLPDAGRAKWLIARCDWFVGARMHATIAALTSGVPCAAISYSPKFRGVFETMGAADEVLDARLLDTQELVAAALHSYERRVAVRNNLEKILPGLIDRARLQMAEVLGVGRHMD